MLRAKAVGQGEKSELESYWVHLNSWYIFIIFRIPQVWSSV